MAIAACCTVQMTVIPLNESFPIHTVIPMGAATDGEALACWTSGDGTARYTVFDPPNNAWRAVAAIPGATTLSGPPVLAYHPASKRATALWIQAGSVYASQYQSGTNWSAPTLFAANNGDAIGVPAMRYYGSGDAVAVWKTATGLSASLYR